MMWTRLGPLGGVLVLAAGAATWFLGAGHGAGGQAGRMLTAAVLPPGAVQVSGLPGSAFSSPSQEPACHPLTDEVRYWTAPGDPAQVAAFLQAHPPAGLSYNGNGSLFDSTTGHVISYDVTDTLPGHGFGAPAGLDLTVAALPGGATGIRADAEVVPPHAACTSSGGGVAARPAPRPAAGQTVSGR